LFCPVSSSHAARDVTTCTITPAPVIAASPIAMTAAPGTITLLISAAFSATLAGFAFPSALINPVEYIAFAPFTHLSLLLGPFPPLPYPIRTLRRLSCLFEQPGLSYLFNLLSRLSCLLGLLPGLPFLFGSFASPSFLFDLFQYLALPVDPFPFLPVAIDPYPVLVPVVRKTTDFSIERPEAVGILAVFSGRKLVAVGNAPPVAGNMKPTVGLDYPLIAPDISRPLVHIDSDVVTGPIEIAPGTEGVTEKETGPV